MFALVFAEKTHLPPDSVVRLPATWDEYQAVNQQRGDSSISRLKYRHGELLLMSPLLQHGKDAHILASVITALLDQLEREYDAFTPVTVELSEENCIEPDYCFYIDIRKQYRVEGVSIGVQIHRLIWHWKLIS